MYMLLFMYMLLTPCGHVFPHVFSPVLPECASVWQRRDIRAVGCTSDTGEPCSVYRLSCFPSVVFLVPSPSTHPFSFPSSLHFLHPHSLPLTSLRPFLLLSWPSSPVTQEILQLFVVSIEIPSIVSFIFPFCLPLASLLSRRVVRMCLPSWTPGPSRWATLCWMWTRSQGRSLRRDFSTWNPMEQSLPHHMSEEGGRDGGDGGSRK